MGTVTFVGAGPGAIDLITVRGARCLARAEVVLFDALTDPAFQTLAPQAHWIDVGKRGFVSAQADPAAPACDAGSQARINALIVVQAHTHTHVVRLKGGDPSLFGRLEEELQACAAAGVSTEVVPGVTAVLAAAAHSQRPLTRRGRGRSVRLRTAVATESGQAQLCPVQAPTSDTEVFYMAGKQLARLSRQLLQAGWPPDTPVSLVSRAGCPDALHTACALHALPQHAVWHSGRPTVVTVGVGASVCIDAPHPKKVTKMPSQQPHFSQRD